MYNLLSLKFLIFAPVIVAALIASPLFGTNQIYIRRFAKTCGTLHFLYSLLFIVFYNFGVESFYEEITILNEGWLSKLGINAAFGIDGITVLLVAITSFIFLLALIFSKTIIRTKHKMYYCLLFLLLTTTLAIYCAKDIFVFLLFWEAEILPLYLLISQWGKENNKTAAMKYLLYLFTGSMFLLVSMLCLFFYGYQTNGELSSCIDFLRVSMTDGIFPVFIKQIMFWGFFISFAFKIPLFPLHTALTQVHKTCTAPVSIILSATIIQTAAYGLIRFNLDLFPELFIQFAPILMSIAAITVIWSAFAANKQKDLNQKLSYLNIVNMGFFLIALSSLTKAGFDGAVFILISNVFIFGGLFTVSGLINKSYKTTSIQELSGIGKNMPLLMAGAGVICFAAAGMPLTVGFIGKFLSLFAAFSADFYEYGAFSKIIAVILIISIIITTYCILKTYNDVFCGTSYSEKKYNDITGHRLMLISVFCFCIFLFGCFPDTLMSIYDSVTSSLLDILRV